MNMDHAKNPDPVKNPEVWSMARQVSTDVIKASARSGGTRDDILKAAAQYLSRARRAGESEDQCVAALRQRAKWISEKFSERRYFSRVYDGERESFWDAYSQHLINISLCYELCRLMLTGHISTGESCAPLKSLSEKSEPDTQAKSALPIFLIVPDSPLPARAPSLPHSIEEMIDGGQSENKTGPTPSLSTSSTSTPSPSTPSTSSPESTTLVESAPPDFAVVRKLAMTLCELTSRRYGAKYKDILVEFKGAVQDLANLTPADLIRRWELFDQLKKG